MNGKVKILDKIKFDQNWRDLAVLESIELHFKVVQTCKPCTSSQKIKNVTFK